jgi:hypothetical protein
VIPKQQRISRRLERSRELGPRDDRHVRRGTKRDDEVIVRDLIVPPWGRHVDDPALDIDRLDGGLHEPGTVECWPDRLCAMAELENTRARLEQQWAELKEVIAADECDLDVGAIPEQIVELARCSETANAAAEHDEAGLSRRRAGGA